MSRRGNQKGRGYLDTSDNESGDEEESNNGREKRNRLISPASCSSCGVILDPFHPTGVDCDQCVQTRIVEDRPWRHGGGVPGSMGASGSGSGSPAGRMSPPPGRSTGTRLQSYRGFTFQRRDSTDNSSGRPATPGLSAATRGLGLLSALQIPVDGNDDVSEDEDYVHTHDDEPADLDQEVRITVEPDFAAMLGDDNGGDVNGPAEEAGEEAPAGPAGVEDNEQVEGLSASEEEDGDDEGPNDDNEPGPTAVYIQSLVKLEVIPGKQPYHHPQLHTKCSLLIKQFYFTFNPPNNSLLNWEKFCN